ncbi:Trypsin [Rubripirellula tenax]|uniref:Trypsin n=1 Tax=Rubripirellula tenax TaxID=2528015 RepID=A0A5C6EN20_9BACT|nr:trypsin-like serine protease [Rubripirellula tenax]TWU48719.1 Trypsin [Rubripirellula tenax]
MRRIRRPICWHVALAGLFWTAFIGASDDSFPADPMHKGRIKLNAITCFVSSRFRSTKEHFRATLLWLLTGWLVLASGNFASAVVWRDDLTDAEVQELARQGQFAGVGTVSGGGTGSAIAPGWVLTARHVVGNGSRVTFRLDGQTYAGTSVSQAGSDVALIRLDANQQLPTSTPFIVPNPGHNPVNQLVWKVGWGQYSSVANSQISRGPSGENARAGTNVINSIQNTSAGSSLVFNNSNMGVNSTPFEVSTAPGDSGGPMMYQHQNQWFIAGVTTGAESGVGFTDANVAGVYDWIVSQTGDIFTPQAAPTQIFWDGDSATPGVQTGPGSWSNQRPSFTAVGGAIDGFNFTWENDATATAVFGTANSGASLITVDSAIRFAGIRFAPNTSTGPFQILAGSGTLEAAAGGATIEAQKFARVGAALVGNQTITKTGAADLLINGDNSAFDGQFVIQEGTAIFDNAASFGTGGFLPTTKTTVADGATLQLRGTGLSASEHLHISGSGIDNKGAIYVSAGNHELTERISLQADATIRVDAGRSLTIGGDQGRFYNPGGQSNTLTQIGTGVAVYDKISNITGLAVVNGIAAGSGGINGFVTLTSGAELRPGDSATNTAIGTFTTDDFTIDSTSLLTIDFDPMAGLIDSLNVTGSVNLAGLLRLNLLSAPTPQSSFLFVNNDGSDTVIGQFSNLNRITGSFGGQSYDFAIRYSAGTGNDIAIAAVPEPTTWVALSLAGLAIGYRRRRQCMTRPMVS